VALTHGLSDRAALEAEGPDLIMDDLTLLLGAVRAASGSTTSPAGIPAGGDQLKEHT